MDCIGITTITVATILLWKVSHSIQNDRLTSHSTMCSYLICIDPFHNVVVWRSKEKYTTRQIVCLRKYPFHLHTNDYTFVSSLGCKFWRDPFSSFYSRLPPFFYFLFLLWSGTSKVSCLKAVIEYHLFPLINISSTIFCSHPVQPPLTLLPQQ